MRDGMTAALLLVTMEPPASLEEEFNDWYDTEHLPQRRSLPGFLTATRWVCLAGWPRWLALYDLASMAAVETPQYQAVSGTRSTPWSARVLPRTVGRSRVLATALRLNQGLQVDPGSVARLLLARYPLDDGGRHSDAAIEDHVLGTARQLAALGALQTRGFVCTTPGAAAVWLTASFGHPVAAAELAGPAGRCGGRGALLFNLYQPYHREPAAP